MNDLRERKRGDSDVGNTPPPPSQSPPGPRRPLAPRSVRSVSPVGSISSERGNAGFSKHLGLVYIWLPVFLVSFV